MKGLRAALPELAGTYAPAPGKRWGGETHLAPRVLTVLAVTGEMVRGPDASGWTTSRARWVNSEMCGNAGPTAWWNGSVVGGWCQDADAVVQMQLLDDIGRDGRKALTRKAEELTRWLDGTRIRPRFPTPLSKAGG